MRIILSILVALSLLGAAHESLAQEAVGGAVHVAEPFAIESGHSWERFGVDKAYASREAAIADAPNVLRSMGYPEGAIELLVAAMREPGTPSHVNNGDVLTFMRTGARGIYTSVPVAFVDPPIKEKMDYSAPSEEWSVTYEGQVYTIGIPEVCNNLYGRPIHAPAAPQCLYVHLTVPEGLKRSVRYTTVGRAPIENFNCWGVIEGDKYRSGAPRNCDTCTWGDAPIDEMERRYGGPLQLFHTSLYPMHQDSGSTEVTLVFPSEARKYGIAVCIEVDNHIYDAALVMPDTWDGGVRNATIPDDYWGNPRFVANADTQRR